MTWQKFPEFDEAEKACVCVTECVIGSTDLIDRFLKATNPCIHQDFPQQRLDVIVGPANYDWQLASGVQVLDVPIS